MTNEVRYVKYVWDQKKLQKIKNAYKNLRKNTEGLTKEDLEEINEKLLFLKEMNDIMYPKEEIINLEEEEEFSYDALNEIESIPTFVKTSLVEANLKLTNFNEEIDKEELPTLSLTNDELISLVHEFLNWLPNQELRIKLKSLLKQKGTIYFDSESDTCYSGNTYTFYLPYYIPFFHIVRDYTLNDFLTFTHELFHGYFLEYDVNVSLFPNHFYLHEIEGAFGEYLALQFLKEKNLFSSMLPTLEKNSYLDGFDNVRDFYIESIAYDLYKRKKDVPFKDIVKKFLEDGVSFLLNESLLEYILLESPKETALYAFSFLTSLDLEVLDQKDREFALETFLNLRKRNANDLKPFLEQHHITFMQDDYQTIRKKVMDLHFQK